MRRFALCLSQTRQILHNQRLSFSSTPLYRANIELERVGDLMHSIQQTVGLLNEYENWDHLKQEKKRISQILNVSLCITLWTPHLDSRKHRPRCDKMTSSSYKRVLRGCKRKSTGTWSVSIDSRISRPSMVRFIFD